MATMATMTTMTTMATMATYIIITNDGVETHLTESVSKHFITLDHLIQYNTADEPITLYTMSEKVFNHLLTYLNHFIETNDPMLSFTGFCKKKTELTEGEQNSYERWVINKKYLSEWETEFYNELDDDMLAKLWEATDYLNCPFLLDSFSVEAGWRKVRGKGKPFNPLN